MRNLSLSHNYFTVYFMDISDGTFYKTKKRESLGAVIKKKYSLNET